MGFTTVSENALSKDLKQTPENVRKVLDFAGWSVFEAANSIDVDWHELMCALNGLDRLASYRWRLLLDKAGKRSFDEGCDGAV